MMFGGDNVIFKGRHRPGQATGMEGGRMTDCCMNCGGGEGASWESDRNHLSRRRNLSRKHHDNSYKNGDSNNKFVSDNNCRRLVKSWTFIAVLSIIVSSCGVVMVSGIDMHPHGGFYQREGGSNLFDSQHSDFGHDDGSNDMIMTCSRPTKSSRAAKYLALKKLDIPCDMKDRKSSWCNLPGDKYPWHAVRRFVFENQGLMRRMYGEVRQLSLLRMEFEDDMDDEMEDERQGPPRGPSLPEDHRRNSILTEVLDESLPRILSDTPPEDQLLLRDHNIAGSTPRNMPSSSFEAPIATSATSLPSSSGPTTPLVAASSSEEQLLHLLTNDTTEAMIGVTMDSVSGEVNGTTTTTTATTGGGEVVDTSPSGGDGTTLTLQRNGLVEELVTEEATASVGVTDVENGDDNEAETTIVTTTEEMMGLNEDQMVDQSIAEQVVVPQQQLNDGFDSAGMAGSIGSDESHDFLNLDKNHILYFDDVGKNRRPVVSGGGGDSLVPPEQLPSQQQQQQQPGKLKAVNACPVKEEVVAPYWANNTRGEILALLNLYPFEQYIHWERCNHENKQMFCRQGCRCEQQYRLHRLLAFDPTNECRGIFSDWFRFPSCCVCRCYLNEYELMMLNAAGQEPNAASAQSKGRTSDRIRSPRKILLEKLVDGPDVQGVDDMHFFYKQGFYADHNHGAQPRRRRQV